MDEYVLNPSLRRILRKRSQLGIGDVTAASESMIDAYNRAEVKPSVFRSLYKPKTKNIISRTFIIPVTDGAVTGYLFEKVKDKAISGQNSLIVLFHDGGWMLGNMHKCNAVSSNICDATGASVLAIDYRLAPKFKFPIPLEDCYEAFLWAAQGARYWKVDPDKIYVMGNCAGGNLAASVSRLARDRKGPKIAGQMPHPHLQSHGVLHPELLQRAQGYPGPPVLAASRQGSLKTPRNPDNLRRIRPAAG